MSDAESAGDEAPSAGWHRAVEEWGNPAVFRLVHRGRDVGHVRFLYPGPTRTVWRRWRRVWEIASWDVVHMVAAWELDDPPPWEGDQSIGLEYSFEPHEISDLISELDALTLSGFGAELVVAPVTSVDAKRRLIADVFHEGHLMGLPGTVGL